MCRGGDTGAREVGDFGCARSDKTEVPTIERPCAKRVVVHARGEMVEYHSTAEPAESAEKSSKAHSPRFARSLR